MQSDVSYLEKSGLLATVLTSQLPEVSWSIYKDESAFLKSLLESPPLLVIVGDTGTSDTVELLFCLRSIKDFNKLPVIFYGENEFSHIMPVNQIFPRSPETFDNFRNAIIRQLKKSFKDFGSERNHWKIPDGYKKPGFQRKQARSLLREEMFRKHLYGEIVGMNITDLSFDGVLEKLCSKLEVLLSVDFISIIYNQDGEFCGKLYLKERVSDEDLSAIRRRCLEAQTPGIRADILTGTEVSYKKEMPETLKAENAEIILNKALIQGKTRKGSLIMGCFTDESSQITEKLSLRLAAMTCEVIEQAARYYKQVNETKLIYKAFSQFLPAPIINDLLLKESEKALLTGEKRRIVVLFSHVRNFDLIVEHNEPQKVVGFLNSHFTNMVRIIQAHGGSIDKFIGDAVFAIFGAPISYIDNTKRAADAALEMISRHKEIAINSLILPDDGFSIGVGLNEGEAIIGNIGCTDKFDYTAIGDTVNLAARLESLTKHYLQDILVSRIIFQQIQKDYYCRLIDRAKVKGKNEATEIYSLISEPEIYSTKWRQLYSRGLKMYTLGNWYTAAQYLRECLEILPDDIVCDILLERCINFQDAPPETWNGAVTLNFK